MENFIHLFNSGGFVMYPLLLLSVITLAIAVERFSYYRTNRRGSKAFFHGVYHAAAQKDWSVVRQLCQEFPSALSRVIASGMENDSSERAMKAAFEDRMEMESINFHRYLDDLASAGPSRYGHGHDSDLRRSRQRRRCRGDHGRRRRGSGGHGDRSLRGHYCLLLLHVFQPSAGYAGDGYGASLLDSNRREKRKLG